jgi:hypothetical protein
MWPTSVAFASGLIWFPPVLIVGSQKSMNDTGFSAPSFSNGNGLWSIAYYFGFPALAACGLGAALWTIVQGIEPRITEIETILAQQNSTIFAELRYDAKKIIVNQEVIRQKEEDLLRSIDDHEHANEQYWSEAHDADEEAMRRLDDIYHQRSSRGDPAPTKKRRGGAN